MFWERGKYELSVHMSTFLKHILKRTDSDEFLFYTVVVFDLRMCMNEDNPSPKYKKGDH